MFGMYQNGQPAAKRLFLITNPNQKRPGPVTITVNEAAIAPGDVRVLMDGEEVFEPRRLMEILHDVEQAPEQSTATALLRSALQLA
jgi:hypothetical protein